MKLLFWKTIEGIAALAYRVIGGDLLDRLQAHAFRKRYEASGKSRWQ